MGSGGSLGSGTQSVVRSLFRAAALGSLAGVLLISQEPPPGWRLIGSELGLALVDVKEVGPHTWVFLKNTSGKTITALEVSQDSTTLRTSIVHGSDFFGTSVALKPGDTYRLVLGIHGLMRYGRTLTVRALVFDDGSYVGSHERVLSIAGERAGIMLETARVAALLKSTPLENADEALIETLKQKIGPLPASAEQAVASVRDVRLEGAEVPATLMRERSFRRGVDLGVSRTRESILRRLNQIEADPAAAGLPANLTKAQALGLVRDELLKQTQWHAQVFSNALVR